MGTYIGQIPTFIFLKHRSCKLTLWRVIYAWKIEMDYWLIRVHQLPSEVNVTWNEIPQGEEKKNYSCCICFDDITLYNNVIITLKSAPFLITSSYNKSNCENSIRSRSALTWAHWILSVKQLKRKQQSFNYFLWNKIFFRIHVALFKNIILCLSPVWIQKYIWRPIQA